MQHQTSSSTMRAVWVLYFIPLIFTHSSGQGLCPDHWLPFNDRCLAVYPVWATWSTAETLCSQSGANLVSLHSTEEVEFVTKLSSKLGVPVWSGGYSVSQSNLWFWSDGSEFEIWTSNTSGKNNSEEACLGMASKNGEMKSAPCNELRFYICSRKSWLHNNTSEQAVSPSGLSPGVSLFSAMWAQSETVAEDIFHSSDFLLQLMSGSIRQSCYDSFSQEETLYMGLVYKTLEALAFNFQEADPEMRSLLNDLRDFYQIKYSKQDPVVAPQWLQFALESFHSIVVDDPVYLLVALSARSTLNSFLLQSSAVHDLMSTPESQNLYLKWTEGTKRDAEFARRFRRVIETHQNQVDLFKSISVFRIHMMNQKSLHKYVECSQ